jgi:WD40 repeat protein
VYHPPKGSEREQDEEDDLQTLKGHSGSVHSVTFSPDSRLLASALYNHTVKL